ncbi:LytR/AlgR family response regulator [Streptococcus dysgalactiae subsp. dysgalactiae]|uniref:LytR/AlgR family response regulator n=1 Tax=Streptococcus dysgalactiae subsp. dysgalactiae TaxID=99822 RepID=A0A380JQX1_STRDY|nr:LytR/AlgR family response regulator [Streptococcus dysgalactiae subsp. dysgalactiae]
MKIVIELDASCENIEVNIKAAQVTEQVLQLQQALLQLERQPLIFTRTTMNIF